MDIEIFALCDAATDYFGKLNILGTFDTFNFKELPGHFPHCAVALRIRFSKIEEGSHKIKINFVDVDGRPFMKEVNGEINIRVPSERPSGIANLILGVNNLKFEKAGQYVVDLAIDGKQIQSLPIFVSLHQKKV